MTFNEYKVRDDNYTHQKYLVIKHVLPVTEYMVF